MANKLKLKPLGGRVIIEPIEQEEITAGGIILPETAKEKPQEGKVLAAGPGDRDEKRRTHPHGFEGWRQDIVRQIFRHRDQNGWQEIAHPARKRYSRGGRKLTLEVMNHDCKTTRFF